MDAITPITSGITGTPSPERQSLQGQSGLDAARRSSPDFASMLTESSAQLAPDPREAADRATRQNLLSQTAAMNVLAAHSSTSFNPAIISYASQLANQVNLESNMPPHRPLRQNFGDRFSERDSDDAQSRIPPINEAKSGPVVL
ncbi:MAG: hypothetical protein FWG36_05715 [Oscillospiraceae bacterium]|nr:hypothetical protein [Oscillospiraceae bacterium]